MKAFWDKFKWALTHMSWVIAGLIALIDPKHIDELAKNHPAWSALILFVWGALVAWANKSKPPTQPDMSQVGQNPANSSQKQVYLQGRRQ